jgi:hypothetical protein
MPSYGRPLEEEGEEESLKNNNVVGDHNGI